MQLGFYFDQSRCSGCFTCIVACKDWHDIPAGPTSRIRVFTMEQGQFPNISVNFLISTCYHCLEPPCVTACPSGAIRKLEENGIVFVDREVCFGLESCGGLCRTACPYAIPQFGLDANAKMEKCDMCMDRWIESKRPVCVEACPMRALDAGPLDELRLKYKCVAEMGKAVGFTFYETIKPSIELKSC